MDKPQVTIQTPEYENQPSQWELWWEDQHPSIRNNIGLAGLSVVIWGVLYLLAYFSPRYMTLDRVFGFRLMEQLWEVTSFILMIILLVNIFRMLVRYVNGLVALSGVLASVASIVLLAITTLNLPSFFQGSTNYILGRPYSEVFEEFTDHCDDWEAQYHADEQINRNTLERDLDFGSFETNPLVDIRLYRGSTVYLSYGDETKTIGLACVLDGGVPPTNGLADDYDYTLIDNNYYEFVDNPEEEN